MKKNIKSEASWARRELRCGLLSRVHGKPLPEGGELGNSFGRFKRPARTDKNDQVSARAQMQDCDAHACVLRGVCVARMSVLVSVVLGYLRTKASR